MRAQRLLRSVVSLAILAGPALPAADIFDGYMDHELLTQTVHELERQHDACAIETIGASAADRPIYALVLSAQPGEADKRPALLVVAGLDGTHLLGTETAVRVARELLENHRPLLDEVTVYVLPRANPDAAELNLGELNAGQIGTLTPVDDDHDGAFDEDGPRDLNGDGVITMMRRLNPPLDDPPTHLPDPIEPRLLKQPDPLNGERAIYTVYIEGVDGDGDGRIAEDGLGQVDLDRNFMHRWPEFEPGAGAYQLSERESLALAEFVLEHRNIVAAIVYGRHDNVINVPDGKGKDMTGEGPENLSADDVKLYQELSKTYQDATGQERAAKEETAGSVHAWLYAHRGIPTIATTVWGRPEVSEPAEEGALEEVEDAPGDAELAQEGHGAKPQAAEESKRESDEKDEDTASDEEGAAWLIYSDRDRGGAGFIAWQPLEHPTLGPVEIGGFVPGFRMNPPASELDALAQVQAAFAVQLIDRRPKLSVVGPEVKTLGPGVYELRLAITNDGFLPTATAMARQARAIPPTVVRLDLPQDRLVAGDAVNRAWGIDGSGARVSHRWIIRAAAGEQVEIAITSAQLGDRTVTFTPSEEVRP